MSRNTNLDKLRALRKDNPYGYEARLYNLIYGLIRGRSIDRIESKNSNPYHFPDPKSLADKTMAFYRPIAEGQDPAVYESEKKAFHAKLIADLTAWKKQLHLNWLTLEATRRQRNAVKRSTPRIHPRPRPQAAKVA
jgi:hypothetical protein